MRESVRGETICDQEERPEKEKPKQPEEREEEPKTRTPVKQRVQKINRKATGSPGMFPGWKKAQISKYYGKKSPKANRAREMKENEAETTNINLQGASNSPLLGDTGQPGT